MTTTIDRAGRVVIPKRLRDALNLGPGVEVEIESEPGGLRLRVAGHAPSLVTKKGFLVHQGNGKTEINVADFINHQRGGRAAGAVRVP